MRCDAAYLAAGRARVVAEFMKIDLIDENRPFSRLSGQKGESHRHTLITCPGPQANRRLIRFAFLVVAAPLERERVPLRSKRHVRRYSPHE
jgi:sortase (surface protein transpeptidase)